MPSKFQLIAYCTPTLGAYPAGTPPKISPGMTEPLKAAVEGSGAPSPDLEARLHRLLHVVERAAADRKVSRESSVQKIFVVPEFYFRPEKAGDPGRPETAGRWYSEADENYLVKALRVLRDDRFKGWLFVCGTVVWSQLRADQLVVWNTAIVVEGGTTKDPALIQKRQYVDGDEIDPGLNPVMLKLADIMATDFKRFVFKTDTGLWVGLEICVDHDCSTVARGVSAHQRLRELYPFEKGLDIRILTACGKKINPGQLGYLAIGRSIVRIDGHTGRSHEKERDYGPSSEIVRILRGRLRAIREDTDVTRNGETGYANDNKALVREVLAADVRMVVDAAVAASYPQELVIYDALPLQREAS